MMTPESEIDELIMNRVGDEMFAYFSMNGVSDECPPVLEILNKIGGAVIDGWMTVYKNSLTIVAKWIVYFNENREGLSLWRM